MATPSLSHGGCSRHCPLLTQPSALAARSAIRPSQVQCRHSPQAHRHNASDQIQRLHDATASRLHARARPPRDHARARLPGFNGISSPVTARLQRNPARHCATPPAKSSGASARRHGLQASTHGQHGFQASQQGSSLRQAVEVYCLFTLTGLSLPRHMHGLMTQPLPF
ncbi:hypothetical protein Zm00014a_029331 [Zea mays]|uniref:Uncharacterized protein n=2 Tax=Zea mays TaxID=4577 RepID=A0A3L6E7F2_MAIZE|nr:hypothetical protein Zm00014a_029331 [Zea mays]